MALSRLHHITVRFAMSTCCCMLVASGCGRSAPPPASISVQSSGVAVKEGVDLSADWPGWRGPSQNGLAPEQAAPVMWGDTTGVLWRADVPGRGHSSPVIVGDTVYLATAVESKQQQSVLAYDRETGDPRWQTAVHEGQLPDAREIHSKGTHANSTVACDGRHVYATFFNNGKITATALDLAGKEVWRQELGAFDSKFGYAPSPILYKSLLIVAVDTHGGFLTALDSESGKIAWRIARPSEHTYSSPTVASLGGRDQLLISGAEKIVSYDPATGEQNWSTDCVAKSTCGTVVTMGDRLFASGGYPQRQTICLSAEGKELWSNKTNIYEPSLLAVAGHVYGVSDEGVATCWSAADGQEQWKQRLSGKFSASPVHCNGAIYVPNLAGKTYVFQASGKAYQEIAVNTLGNDSYASPAIHQGRIYMRVGVGNGGSRKEQLCCIAAP